MYEFQVIDSGSGVLYCVSDVWHQTGQKQPCHSHRLGHVETCVCVGLFFQPSACRS